MEKGSEPNKDLGKILPGRGNSHAKVLSQSMFALLEKQQVSDLENYMSEGSDLRMEKEHPMFSYIQENEISNGSSGVHRG